MSAVLDMTVPVEAGRWLADHEWVQRHGDGETTGCLHTALLRPCSTPGGESWNDEPGRTKDAVLAVLLHPAEPTEVEMVGLFGPQWLAIRDLVRRAAVLTRDDRLRLTRARAAARDAARDAAWGAAWAAAWAAARDAARGAALALVVRDLIGRYGFTADHYRALTRPWASIVGPTHPDDKKGGLALSRKPA